MKRVFRILSVLAVALSAATANAASLRVGPCNGEIAEQGFAKAGNATVEVALLFSPEMLEAYKGAQVTAIRVGLCIADGMTDFKAWLRPDLEGETIAEATGAPAKGWNELTLAQGVTIDGSQLAVGFSFHQTKSVRCISAVGKSQTDGLWVAKNGEWAVPSQKGVLSVELVVTDPSYPSVDLAIKDVTFSPSLVKKGETTTVTVNVSNAALTTVNGLDWKYTLNGSNVGLHSDAVFKPQKTIALSAEIPTESLEEDVIYPLEISLDCPDDEVASNNSVETVMGCYSSSFPRRVLIEEFTTENCPNCPRAINTLHQAEEAGYGDKMAVIAHHVGYHYDWLTIEEEKQLEWFYDPSYESGTFAPAVMLDRTISGENTVPVESIGYFNTFESRLQEATEVPALVEVTPTMTYDESGNRITVDVEISSLPLLKMVCANPRINVFLVEDGIVHHDQAGISSTDFTHSHVSRKSLTELFGNPVDLESGEASLSFSCDKDEAWVPGNLQAVAFVSSYNPDDVSDCKVFNTGIARLGETLVSDTFADETGVAEYYNPAGIRVQPDSEGIVIRKVKLSDGSFKITKSVNR